MRRRDFIKLIAGSVAQLPLGVYAQQSPRKRRVGILMIAASSFVDQIPAVDQITRRLRDLGWVDGRNLDFEIGWADRKLDKARELAKQFVAAECDVIVTQVAITVKVLQRETSTIPIVFWLVPDPVGEGLVAEFGPARVQHYGLYQLRALDCDQMAQSIEGGQSCNPGLLSRFTLPPLKYPPTIRPKSNLSYMHPLKRAISLVVFSVLPDALTVGSKDIILALAARLRVPANLSLPPFCHRWRLTLLRRQSS